MTAIEEAMFGRKKNNEPSPQKRIPIPRGWYLPGGVKPGEEIRFSPEEKAALAKLDDPSSLRLFDADRMRRMMTAEGRILLDDDVEEQPATNEPAATDEP
jgi:hypothetical protein